MDERQIRTVISLPVAERERQFGKETMTEFRGGLRWVGSFFKRMNVSYPMGKLTIHEDHVILGTPFSEFTLYRNEVIRMSVKNRIFYKGIVFTHSNESMPETLVFWSFQPDRVLAEIGHFMGR